MSESNGDFDVLALYNKLDQKRQLLGLSWSGVARELWDQSELLNERDHFHPISPATITGMTRMRDTSCQHALFMLRWLGSAPEDFVPGSKWDSDDISLPSVDKEHRLRWNLKRLYEELDVQRRSRDLTWSQLAAELRCTTSQLTGIKKAKFAIGMKLAIRITNWLERPAREFIYASKW
jgi:hypothetical protein